MANANEIIRWIDGKGTSYTLTDPPSVDVLADREGFYTPPISYDEDYIIENTNCSSDIRTSSEFMVVRNMKIQPRELKFRLKVTGTDRADVRQKVRSWVSAFSPLKGQGRLEVTAPDGVVRYVNCRYLSGLEGTEGVGDLGENWQILSVVLRALDPYWYSTTTSQFPVEKDTTAGTIFKNPFFPMRLSNAASFGSVTVTNNGEAIAYPTWSITGPADNIILINDTTGRTLKLTRNLASGETMTIITDPKNRKILVNGTEIDTATNTTEDSTFWSLEQGSNAVRVELDNSVDPYPELIAFPVMNVDTNGDGLVDGWNASSLNITASGTRVFDSAENAQRFDVTATTTTGYFGASSNAFLVTGGSYYNTRVDAKLLVSSGIPKASLRISWYTETDGATGFISTDQFDTTASNWSTIQRTNIQAPPTAKSGRMRVTFTADATGDSGSAWFKNASFTGVAQQENSTTINISFQERHLSI